MSGLDDPSSGLNKSQFDEMIEQEAEQFAQENKIENKVSEIIDKEEEKVQEKVEEEPLKVSATELTQEQKEKINYISEIENAGVKDKAVVDNLMYMLETGFTNF